VRDATVWTQTGSGILEDADLLVVGGKVAAVGRGLAAPGRRVGDRRQGPARHPGIIDAHSHSAIDGHVNEGSHNVTAEVRISDVIDPFDVVDRAPARRRHDRRPTSSTARPTRSADRTRSSSGASARGPQGLYFEGAPEGIKFALGENPSRATGATRSRAIRPRAWASPS
jgi:imidazolonepropionase-like amidohydrolase